MREESYMSQTEGQKLFEELSLKNKNAWDTIDEEQKEKLYKIANDYKTFLNECKTERETVDYIVKLAKQHGFKDYHSYDKMCEGDKVYFVNKGKNIILAVIGKEPLNQGINLIGAHIDSPRLDLKPKPVYESNDLAFLKTHYYGGIKKFHWVNVPLAIHGVVVKSDGTTVNIKIGEDENDPIFYITDLLIHLSSEQMQKKASEVIPAENLNILIGSIPYPDKEVKERVKLNILKILSDYYGICEEDLISAEIEIVPAAKARDVGFDRGLVGAYGQDDRVCAYLAMKALFDLEDVPQKTSVVFLVDKEEIGSVGITSAEANFLDNSIVRILKLTGRYTDLFDLYECYENSNALSADVAGAVDPNHEGVFDKLNASFVGKGVTIEKYTGVRGKYSGSDANAEYVGKVRNFLNKHNICWQTGLLGKVDQGGGGTIALFIARKMINVIDSGVPVLSMHSTFEITSKVDIYMAYRFYKEFLREF
ncbi:aminopeptidase [Caldicellulosiruptoraceae bacterium PP1]